MIAIIPVRSGVLPLGGLEAIAEAGGRAVLIGSGCQDAVESTHGIARELELIEVGAFAPGAWAQAVAPLLMASSELDSDLADVIIVPHSPDGRDLAPRLAAAAGRPLLAGAIAISAEEVQLARMGSRTIDVVAVDRPIVATLQPGVRSATPTSERSEPSVHTLDLGLAPIADRAADAAVVAELPPDPSTMDLSEAPRIVGGGAGLGSAEAFDQLTELADHLGASMGGTRVVMDWGWIPFERQIGTTGIIVDPEFYLALGISGAVQHTAGLGSPQHMISVNTDPHCPMMALADIAITCDAPAFLDALVSLLAGETPGSDEPERPGLS